MNTGQWNDHAIGVGGSDPISLFAYLSTGGSYKQAIKLLETDPIVTAAIASGTTAPVAKAAKPANLTKVALARRVYANASTLGGTAAENYLTGRGLHQTAAWGCLRSSMLSHPQGGRHPTLLAPFIAPDGSIAGVHRTYLTPAGAKLGVEPVRLSLAR